MRLLESTWKTPCASFKLRDMTDFHVRSTEWNLRRNDLMTQYYYQLSERQHRIWLKRFQKELRKRKLSPLIDAQDAAAATTISAAKIMKSA